MVWSIKWAECLEYIYLYCMSSKVCCKIIYKNDPCILFFTEDNTISLRRFTIFIHDKIILTAIELVYTFNECI